MKNNTRKGDGFGLSFNMYLCTKSDLDKENDSFKKSYIILLVTLILILNFVFNFFPYIDVMKSDLISGFVFLAFLASTFTTIFFFIELKKKKKLEMSHLNRLKSDYSVYMIEKNKVWFNISGDIFPVNLAELTEDYITELFTNSVD
jgi:hypothetical protein